MGGKARRRPIVRESCPGALFWDRAIARARAAPGGETVCAFTDPLSGQIRYWHRDRDQPFYISFELLWRRALDLPLPDYARDVPPWICPGVLAITAAAREQAIEDQAGRNKK